MIRNRLDRIAAAEDRQPGVEKIPIITIFSEIMPLISTSNQNLEKG